MPLFESSSKSSRVDLLHLPECPSLNQPLWPGRWEKLTGHQRVGKPVSHRDEVGEAWSPREGGALPPEEKGLEGGQWKQSIPPQPPL